jgi:uncharacterized protein involved in exopolysaccharide biosynthesis
MESRNLNYWIELVFRRQQIVFTLAGTVLGIIVVGTIFWPPVYESTAKILVQDNRAQLLVSPDLRDDSPQRPAVVSNPVTEEDLNSERELITSLYLIRQAIDRLAVPPAYSGPGAIILNAVKGALRLPVQGYRSLHDGPKMTPADRWALDLASNIDSNVIKRSDIIEVTFRSHDSEWSHRFLTLLLNHYLEFHARISHDPQAEQFFQEQAKLLRDRLAASEQQLNAFQLQTGISDFGGQQQALISQLSDLQLQGSKAGADLASAEEQVATLSRLGKATPQRIGKETRSVQNLALQQLKPQVMQLKAERAELLSRYQPTSGRIREIDAKLAAAQRILDLEDHFEVTEQSTDLNPVWVTIDSSLAQAQANAASLKATIGKLDEEIGKTRDRLDLLVRNSPAFERLQRQVASDKQAYLSYVRKTEEARAAGALNSDKILNLSIAQPPLRPLRPVFPIVWLNFTVGLVLAAGLGIAAAEFEERRDPKIYSTAIIAKESGLQTVAVLVNQG